MITHRNIPQKFEIPYNPPQCLNVSDKFQNRRIGRLNAKQPKTSSLGLQVGIIRPIEIFHRNSKFPITLLDPGVWMSRINWRIGQIGRLDAEIRESKGERGCGGLAGSAATYWLQRRRRRDAGLRHKTCATGRRVCGNSPVLRATR